MANAAMPQQAQLDDASVRAVLQSPRLLRREVLAGLVVALALIPRVRGTA